MRTYHGEQCPNAILRGETSVQPGDTFISGTIDHKGFVSMTYKPLTYSPDYAYKHFQVLATGTFATCSAAAKSALENPFP